METRGSRRAKAPEHITMCDTGPYRYLGWSTPSGILGFQRINLNEPGGCCHVDHSAKRIVAIRFARLGPESAGSQ